MNGRILVRLPAGLHAALVARAQHEGVSLNMLAVALLAGGIGWRDCPHCAQDEPCSLHLNTR